jgi:PAS domain S-box-containing protein
MQNFYRESNYLRKIRSSLLRKGELEFRRLLEKLPAGAYTCNPQGLITYFNQQATLIWGRTPQLNDATDRFCGSSRLYLADGTPLRHDECWMALAIRNQREYNRKEIIIERPNGDRLTVLAHANPIYDEFGKLLGAVNVLVDITDRKESEDALKQADKAKNQFLAVLAHELRNPLAPIVNAVEMLRLELPRSEKTESLIGVIDGQMRQMTRLIDDLLDIARVSSNKLELRKTDIQLKMIINAALEISAPQIKQRGLEFITRLPQEPVYLHGDLTRLAQVLSNLLNNAAKYTDPGGRIWLTAERKSAKIIITVRDTGIGISSEVLSKIFEMFTQGDQSIERSHGGLGIGLTLAKQLVELHGGTVTAFSDGPGNGSTFTITLPTIEPPAVEIPSLDRSDSEIHLPLSLKILIVEDNLVSAEMMSMILKTRDCDVCIANDGFEGLRLAEKFRPQLILLDIGLPKMNGYDLAKNIRHQPWGDSIVLVAITGWGEESERLRCAEVGIDYHLVKPVHPSDLLNLLRRLKNRLSESTSGNKAILKQ